MAAKPPKLGEMNVTIEVVERKLLPPVPGTGEVRHCYEKMFLTRAAVKTNSGLSEFAGVDVNGKKATHTFTIRCTHIPFDIRNRVRDVRGKLYSILSVENVDLENRLIHIHCSNQGSEDVEAAT